MQEGVEVTASNAWFWSFIKIVRFGSVADGVAAASPRKYNPGFDPFE
jgi:hypothetical protein